MTKILSVLIPTYNMEKYLRHCLDSLIVTSDLMDQLEVLIVNDGSKDKSSEIGHEYESKYPQTFKVIDKENSNYGSCVNVGLQQASGKYIKVLDADDSFDNKAFFSLLTILNGVDVDLVVTDFVCVNEQGTVTKSEEFDLPVGQIRKYEELSQYPTFLSLPMHAVTYKTDNLRGIGYKQTEGISYTDQEWMFAPFTTVKTAVYHKFSVYRYLLGREGQTMDPKVLIKNISHTKQGIASMMKFYNSSKYEDVYSEYLSQRLLNRIRYIYYTYLTKGYDMDMNDLFSFDDELKKTNKELYDKSENFYVGKILKYKYVKKWRKSLYKTPPLSDSIQLLLTRWF